MKNFVQSGSALTIPAPAAVASGDVVIVGNIIGIANAAAAAGADLDVTTTGVFSLPKVSGYVFAVGATVYFNTSTKLATTTASGNTAIGTAVAAAGVGAALVKVRLKSFLSGKAPPYSERFPVGKGAARSGGHGAPPYIFFWSLR